MYTYIHTHICYIYIYIHKQLEYVLKSGFLAALLCMVFGAQSRISKFSFYEGILEKYANVS